jgi:LysR family transcriptional regulator for bpeEF and oprC
MQYPGISHNQLDKPGAQMDRLDALKVFCAVVDCGGFSKAAEKLGISTSSVTHQIGTLEAHFGVKLLNRTTRSMSLTDEGRQCVEQARRLLEDMGELESSLNLSRRAPSGTLRIDLPGILARLYVAPALPAFLERHPALNVKMTASDRLTDMVDEGVDVLIRIGELPSSNLFAKTLARTSYVTCASPGFIARHGQPRTPEQLDAFRCLNFVYPKARQIRPWAFQRNGEGLTHTPRGALASDHVESLIEMALAGGGIVQHFSVSLAEHLRSGALVALLVDWQAPGPDVSVLFQHKHQRAAKIKAFIDFAEEVFRDTPTR